MSLKITDHVLHVDAAGKLIAVNPLALTVATTSMISRSPVVGVFYEVDAKRRKDIPLLGTNRQAKSWKLAKFVRTARASVRETAKQCASERPDCLDRLRGYSEHKRAEKRCARRRRISTSQRVTPWES